jgi:iron complex outermembrane receptor protein
MSATPISNNRSAAFRYRKRSPKLSLMMSAAVLSCFGGFQAAQAQNPAAAADAAGSSGLEEIIVTATKRADTVNRVPLSIVALPQNALIEQDLRSTQDISRAVPGLFVTSSNNSTGAAVAIRGIASSIGAPTTAVYLDDVPVQKRLVNGTSSGGGAPFPQLYDLERVEVLKGPQGTLYGESSEGGAIRFITPQPSLTDFSGTARSELSGTQHGGLNYEEGAALGGPIVEDILGFRVSLWDRHDSGYINHVFPYTDQTIGTGTNSENRWEGHGALTLAPIDNLKLTASFYQSRDKFGDSDTYIENFTSAYTVGAHGSVPAHTYGPYPYYGPYQTINNCNIGANYVGTIPACYQARDRISTLSIPSLSVDYDFDDFTIHSSTAYEMDVGKGADDAGMGDLASSYGGFPLLPFDLPEYTGKLPYNDARNTEIEELRFTSTPNDGPWSWVGGLFASNQQTHQRSQDYSSGFDAAIMALTGQTVLAHYAAPTSPDGGISQRDQHLRETEYAAFGEVSYKLLDDLKGIVGLRVARDEIKYYSYIEGPFFGFANPTFANGGLSGGDQFATAVLPKFTLQYQLDENQSIYATASKG